ncbi:MAG: sugar ABC transporter ATP-binding protein [Lautropia sp.]
MATLQVTGLNKRFGATQALKDVSFALTPGRTLALLGENGAGKSTLIKILAGVYQADGGEVRLDERPVRFGSPADAMRHGIVLVPQELRVVPGLTVAENICLADIPARRRWGLLPSIDTPAMQRRAAAILAEIGAEIRPDAVTGRLSFAERQIVVIARALGHDASLLILDEPTASLEHREVERLFAVMQRLRERGIAIVYVSHRLEEIDRVATQCIVMRDGRIADRFDHGPFTAQRIVAAMSGRPLEQHDPRTAHGQDPGPVRLEQELPGGTLHCRAGEIVGLAGLLGSGTGSLLHRLFGVGRPGVGLPSGVTVRSAIAAGHGLVPGERARALAMSMSVRDNIVLPNLAGLSSALGLHGRRIDALVGALMDELDIRPRDPGLPVRALSGGNQQKVAFAKWLLRGDALQVLLLDEPTNGIDIASKALIHRRIRQFSERGGAVLIASSEAQELLFLSDRLCILRQGRLTANLTRENLTGEALRFALEH